MIFTIFSKLILNILKIDFMIIDINCFFKNIYKMTLYLLPVLIVLLIFCLYHYKY